MQISAENPGVRPGAAHRSLAGRWSRPRLRSRPRSGPPGDAAVRNLRCPLTDHSYATVRDATHIREDPDRQHGPPAGCHLDLLRGEGTERGGEGPGREVRWTHHRLNSLGFPLRRGVKTKAIGSWHKSGNGQCLITANDKHDFWTAFHLQILQGDNAREVEALRRDRCADDRSDPARYPGYADGEGFCSAYDTLNPGGGYRAVGAVDRYYVEIRLPGDRPNSHPDAPKKPRERFSRSWTTCASTTRGEPCPVARWTKLRTGSRAARRAPGYVVLGDLSAHRGSDRYGPADVFVGVGLGTKAVNTRARMPSTVHNRTQLQTPRQLPHLSGRCTQSYSVAHRTAAARSWTRGTCSRRFRPARCGGGAMRQRLAAAGRGLALRKGRRPAPSVTHRRTHHTWLCSTRANRSG